MQLMLLHLLFQCTVKALLKGHGAVVEVPVEMEVPAADSAEPPEIDRDLPYVAESEMVVIDGVRYNMDSTLRHLREACICTWFE